MEPNFEQNIPILYISIAFIVLCVITFKLRSYIRELALVKQGQIFHPSGRMPTIAERLAGDKEWASGSIKSYGKIFMVILWILAIVWNLTFGVSFYKNLFNPTMKLGGKIALGFFSVAGIVPLYFAIRQTRRFYRYGESICCITGKAGVLGEEMSGIIRTTSPITPTGDYKVTLQCTEV